jgi:hypothetical protein
MVIAPLQLAPGELARPEAGARSWGVPDSKAS